MSKIARYILMGAALLLGAGMNAANPNLKVYNADVTVNDQTRTLTMVLELNMKDFKLGSNGEATYTPVVLSQDGRDSVVMSPFTVCGRNRYYYYMREGLLDTGLNKIYRAGSKEMPVITETVPFESWMANNGTVEVRQVFSTCCGTPKLVPGNSRFGNVLVAQMHNPAPTPILDVDYVFTPPKDEGPVMKSIEGKAFVTFVVNRTELNPKYMNNPAEIKKILTSIDVVKADPDAVITEVHIRGYASPEGPYDNNVRLAKGRTETLANYVNSLYKFKEGIMTTSYDPEDWGGLRSYVKDSLDFNLTNRPGLLAVIDGPLGFDAKDAALKRQFPQDYDVILKEIYPWLRHSDYAVKYNIKVFTDINDLMRLYSTDPSKLRPVDFYLIAEQYPEGSKEYYDALRKGVEVYPDDPELNINMANIYMMEGKFDEAQSCLLKATQLPEANFARGILAAKRGDYLDAEKRFQLAKDGGMVKAGEYLETVKALLEQEKARRARGSVPVEMLIPTTK